MRIPAWRAFLLGGLVAMAVYLLPPNTERSAAAGSAVFHYASAVAVLIGIRRYQPADPWPWRLLATALLALGSGDTLLFVSSVGDVADLLFLFAFAALAGDHDALLYVDDAHGFGVLGERGAYDPSPHGRRGNGIVRWSGEGYDRLVLTAGFSKAYSSLLAFAAVPAGLRHYLKLMVPTYCYGGPVPVASLATALLGLEVNERRGDDLRARLWHRTRTLLDHLDKLGVATSNTSDFPLVELSLADPEDQHPSAATCSTAAST